MLPPVVSAPLIFILLSVRQGSLMAEAETDLKHLTQADTAEAVLLDYVERYGLTDRARRYFLNLGQEEAAHGSRTDGRDPQVDQRSS